MDFEKLKELSVEQLKELAERLDETITQKEELIDKKSLYYILKVNTGFQYQFIYLMPEEKYLLDQDTENITELLLDAGSDYQVIVQKKMLSEYEYIVECEGFNSREWEMNDLIKTIEIDKNHKGKA